MSRRRAAQGVRVLAVLTTVAAVATGAGWGLISAGASPSSYQALASASGFRISIATPGLSVVNTLVDVGGPSAQALVDSIGTSMGFAAHPDPGELVLTGPGLLAGLTGAPLPEYPLVVQSTYPAEPHVTLGGGPYLLEATSEPLRSSGSATTGSSDPVVARTSALAEAALDGDVAVAEAASTAQSVVVGPLTIARVNATARSASVAGGPSELASDFSVEGLNIEGTPVGLTPDGLVLAGSTIALPPSDPARAALAEAGIELRYLEPRTTEDTAFSAGVEVTVRHVAEDGIPNVIPPGQVIELRVVFGQVSATSGAGGSLGPVAPAATSEVAIDLPAAPVAGPRQSLPPVTAPTPATPSSPAAGRVDQQTATAGAHAPRSASSLLDPDALEFYWVLVAGAVAAALATNASSSVRGRKAWLVQLRGGTA